MAEKHPSVAPASGKAIARLIRAVEEHAFKGTFSGTDQWCIDKTAAVEAEYDAAIIALKRRIAKLEQQVAEAYSDGERRVGRVDTKARIDHG